MDKKRIIISLIVMLVLAVTYIIYNQTTKTIIPQAPLPPEDISPQGQGGLREDGVYELPETSVNVGDIPESVEKLAVNSVIIDNFYRNNQTIQDNGDAVVESGPNHQIVFLSEYNQFIVNVIGSPFDEARAEAEQAFIDSLFITEEQACNLNVRVVTTVDNNPEESGSEYSLSFCN